MENELIPQFKVGDFLAVVNQSLELAFGSVEIVGEVSSFKVSQDKYVFFDLRDGDCVVNCFMMLYQLRVTLQEGMQVVIRAIPKVTDKGRFSLTVQAVRLIGEGALKKSFELLKKKLDAEGLFSDERKRILPAIPLHIAVISSVQAAGYADFVKIINDRWGGVRVEVAHVQVQGEPAPDQIIRAIRHFNESASLPEVLVIIRGGGSAEDLAAFNDELLVREIATSRVPTLVGVGHEVDETLADLVADVRAATPSNAAEIVVPDKRQMIDMINQKTQGIIAQTLRAIDSMEDEIGWSLGRVIDLSSDRIDDSMTELEAIERVLRSVNPMAVLDRGYALMRGDTSVGSLIEIETSRKIIKAKVEESYEK